MKIFTIALCCTLLLVSCGSTPTASLPSKIVRAEAEAFGLQKNFIIALAGADQNMPFTQIVAKSGSGFLLYKKDSTGVVVCDNAEGARQCQKTKDTLLEKKDTDLLLRVAEKSLWRIVGRETSLTNTEITKNSATPKFTLSDSSKLPTTFKKFFPEKKEAPVDYCLTSKKSEEQEIVCIWNDLTPLYQYMDTSDLPITSTRAILSYDTLTLSQNELVQLTKDLKGEVLH